MSNACVPSLGSIHTIWYSWLKFNGFDRSDCILKWYTVVPTSLAALKALWSPSAGSAGCAMNSPRRKPSCGACPPGTKILCCQWSWGWSAQLGDRQMCFIAKLEDARDQEASKTGYEVGKSSTLVFNRTRHTWVVFSDPFTPLVKNNE